ncbi:hypothetical protein HPP92_019356 [Vanilla planifolia]|uniref:Uncharacterized protein n=1 Tax=Vanilla planifolia TaxID=51239 RepID=A0A835QCB5_VANPL|nr:hypothetical protein HPP92_019356 [Vanilla planifolia]
MHAAVKDFLKVPCLCNLFKLVETIATAPPTQQKLLQRFDSLLRSSLPQAQANPLLPLTIAELQITDPKHSRSQRLPSSHSQQSLQYSFELKLQLNLLSNSPTGCTSFPSKNTTLAPILTSKLQY